MTRIALLITLLAAGSWPALSDAAPATQKARAAAAQPERIMGDQCVECHETESTMHVYHNNCADCHTGSDPHAKAEKPESLKVGMPDTGQCMSCHAIDSRRIDFNIGEHKSAGVPCADCHGLHSPKVTLRGVHMEKTGEVTALCATCHQDVVAKFDLPSHHPVKEGAVNCDSCHDPHSANVTALGSKTSQCTTCHQAMRGPHVFEHPPAAEDCGNCHDPHGSANRSLLAVAQPMQCLQCHVVAANRHGLTGATSNAQAITGAMLRDCVTCHATVHGSSVDQHLRF